MDTTQFLASLWGPVMIAVSIGLLSNRSYYKQLYRDIGKDAFAGILFGIVAMTAGIAQVLYHNLWDTFTQCVVSLLGWGLLIKGALYSAMPKLSDRMGESWAKLKFGPIAGSLVLLIGSYLTWFAYLA